MRKVIAGNWKMNGGLSSLAELVAIEAAAARHPMVDVRVAVPATLIAPARAAAPALSIGAQDVHASDSGAHTGCIAAAMVKEAGAAFTLVGHSERRADQGETGHEIWAKAKAAQRHGLSVILCVGESEAERDVGRAARVVQAQIEESLPEGARGDWFTIAYEPRWAIGTGRTPTAADIADIHLVIRRRLDALCGGDGAGIAILYGGSVNDANAAEILAIPEVDGALVGGASLAAAKFAPIIAAAAC